MACTVSVTDHKCGISILSIFKMVFLVFGNFSYGIAVLCTHQSPPPAAYRSK